MGCTLCGDSGTILSDRNTARICNCVERERMARRLAFAQIPLSLQGKTVNGFKMEYYSTDKTDLETGKSHYELAMVAKDAAIDYVKNFIKYSKKGVGLYIYYPETGTGKTHLAVAVLSAIIKMYGVSGAFTVENQLFTEIKNGYSKSKSQTAPGNDIKKALKDVDVLMLDDIGKEKKTEWIASTTFEIIDSRITNGKISIFTSNYSLQGLRRDEHTKSRIESTVGIIRLAGEDNRLKIAKS